MKYLIALAFILIPSVSFAAFNNNVAYGDASSSVFEVQELLYREDCLTVQPTGYFGALTLSAVKCFQYKYGIIQTGYWGALSRAKANELIALDLGVADQAREEEATTTPIVPETKIIYLNRTMEPQANPRAAEITEKMEATKTGYDNLRAVNENRVLKLNTRFQETRKGYGVINPE